MDKGGIEKFEGNYYLLSNLFVAKGGDFDMEYKSQRNKLDVTMELTELHVKLAKESGVPTLPQDLEEVYLKYAYLVQYTPEMIAEKVKEKNRK